eukprot:scaffold5603_cov45-Prasinocladus_malaysianus.AAC.3
MCGKVSIYGLFRAEAQGAHYHYYDHELNPPESEVAKVSWEAVKALAAAGLVQFKVLLPYFLNPPQAMHKTQRPKADVNLEFWALASTMRVWPTNGFCHISQDVIMITFFGHLLSS